MQWPLVQGVPVDQASFDATAVVRIVESGQISQAELDDLAQWVGAGGVALISGAPDVDMAWCAQDERASPEAVLSLAGLRVTGHDPTLTRARPAIVEPANLLFPIQAGSGLQLGSQGLGHALGLEAVSAKPLARVYRDRLEAGFTPVLEQHPAMTARTVGEGTVYFSSVSLARVAHCYPDANGQATDCSAAASAQALMRIMLANMLWTSARQQWPVPRQSPGNAATVVAVTGDVHADRQGIQVKSAVSLAEIAKELGIPVTFFVVGQVAEQFPADYEQLRSMANVEIGTHSLRGQQYRLGHSMIPFRRRGGVHGSDAVFEDVRAAEQLLGLASWPAERSWLTAIRTEAWGSNQVESRAWTGMARAGIGLVLDHNVDAITTHPAITPPRDWLKADVRTRLSIPAFSRNVHTASDDFRSTEHDLHQMFTLPSPQPDPCCNQAVRFVDYLEYVRDWHEAITAIGTVVGATQVWLWHPSTPAVQGALEELRHTLQVMAEDNQVRFSSMNELAAWNANRHQGRLEVALGDDRDIRSMGWKTPANEQVTSLPPDSHRDSGTVSFWVFGPLEVEGWDSHAVIIDDNEVTILSQRADRP